MTELVLTEVGNSAEELVWGERAGAQFGPCLVRGTYWSSRCHVEFIVSSRSLVVRGVLGV